jgi:tetratricopeptide (TPR) repeat protein
LRAEFAAPLAFAFKNRQHDILNSPLPAVFGKRPSTRSFIVAIAPNNPNERGAGDALQRALLAVQNGRAAEAEAIARDMLKANAGHLEAVKVLAYALLMQDKPEAAAPLLEKAARTTRNPEIETQLAIALRKTGDIDKAMVWLKRATKRMPPFAPAFYELGCTLHLLRRSGEAIEVLSQAIAAAPMMIELHLQLGSIYNELNDRLNAGRTFARALAINPRHLEAMNGMALVLTLDGRYAEAADLYRAAIGMNPEDVSARIALGGCLLELGKVDIAHACLRAAAARGAQVEAIFAAILLAGRGRFWLRPSRALEFLKSQ